MNRQTQNHKVVMTLLLVVAAIGSAASSYAVPLFARQTQVNCGSCHAPPPSLTKFGRRFKGTGAIAELVVQRFRLACRANGLNRSPHALNTSAFALPKELGHRLDLF